MRVGSERRGEGGVEMGGDWGSGERREIGGVMGWIWMYSIRIKGWKDGEGGVDIWGRLEAVEGGYDWCCWPWGA